MNALACPHCGATLDPPGGYHGIPGQTMHSNRDCPSCGRPLIFFQDGPLGRQWRANDAEERRRRLRDRDD